MALMGWYGDNSGGMTHAVGLKKPNAFGLYDMHGNTSEWCVDAWEEDVYKMRVDGVCDPTVAIADKEANVRRVVRGGYCDYWAGYCRAAYRDWFGPVYRGGNLGFRVCLFPGPCRAESRQEEETAQGPGDGARR